MRSVALLIFFTTLLSVSQTMLYVVRKPDDFIFPLIHNFLEDYYHYLAVMRQGWSGFWIATSWLTPEKHPAVFVNTFLLLLGHIARWFNLSLPLVYTVARVIGGGTLMALTYVLIHRVFPASVLRRLTAFCFVLFGTFFWEWGSGGPTVANLTHAWTELDPLFRWSFIPHHLWSKVAMITTFILLLKTVATMQNLLLLTTVVVIAGFINPVVYATMLPTVAIWSVLEFIRNKIQRTKLQFYLPWLVAVISIAFVAVYHRYIQTHVFPWNSYLVWEKTLQYSVNPVDYVKSLGPNLLLFLFAIPALWKLGRVGTLLITWAASSWLMLYVFGGLVPITVERFLGGYQFIPLGIGAAVTIFSLKRPRLLRLLAVGAMLGYLAVGIVASIKEQAGYVAANKNNIQVYVPQPLVDAFRYLERNGDREEVVMAPYEISSMIPAFTGKRVMAGHAMFTQNVGEKKILISLFFSAKDARALKQIISSYGINWVLADSAWRSPQGLGLIKKFGNTQYIVYGVE